MRLVYIAGPISSDKPVTTLENIRRGTEAGKREILRGNAAIIPHLDYSLFLTGGPSPTLEQIQCNSLEQMRRCDKVLFLPGWENSRGCQAEMSEAKRLGMDIEIETVFTKGTAYKKGVTHENF